jgi:iron complex transport system ATP-binding protein
MTPILNAAGVHNHSRLHATDLRIGHGELIALIGPNGSGKTSLLRALADVDGAAETLEIDGEDVRKAARSRRPRLLTFLPASREIVWPIAVRDVIALGAQDLPRERTAEMLELLELKAFAGRPISSLSTGERSRALLARALAPAPRLLLLDEPLSNMDLNWALRTLEILRSVANHTNCSAMVALHDLNQLERFDRIIVMHRGRLVLDGPPAALTEHRQLEQIFGVERRSGRWEIRRTGDPLSSQ